MTEYIHHTAEEQWIQRFITATFDGIQAGVEELRDGGYGVRYPADVTFEINTGDGTMKFTLPFISGSVAE
jgi:hypothetical protein